jgi:hypothetical protein
MLVHDLFKISQRGYCAKYGRSCINPQRGSSHLLSRHTTGHFPSFYNSAKPCRVEMPPSQRFKVSYSQLEKAWEACSKNP